ncbi:MAG: VWA domain-containing protein [Chloroflexi bacterium]|nr:VWA domain-containing protein [Chloroflexota bacterium]
MSWAAPLAFAWAGLTVAVLAFFLLRPRRQRVVVASLLIWRRTIHARAEDTWLAWLRRHAVLLLQLLAVVVFALALARPERLAMVELGSPMALVVDVSASMAIADRDGTPRIQRARDEAAALVNAVGDDRRISVITAGAVPRTLVAQTTDRAAVSRSLDGIEPEASNGRIDAALDMARSLADPAAGGIVALFTDKASTGGSQPAFAGVRTVFVGEPVPNVALVAFQVRRRLDAPDVVQGVVAARNEGSTAATAAIAVTAGRGTTLSRSLDLPAGARQILVFDELPVAPGYQAEIRAPDDGLPTDNLAFASLAEPSALSVVVVGNEPWPIVRALQAVPAVTAQAISVDAFDQDASPADLYVFQDFAPETLPPASSVLVQPPAMPALELDAPITGDVRPLALADSPLLRSVDVGDLRSGADVTYAPPPWALVDLSVGDRALLAHGVVDGRRIAVVGFDVAGPSVSQAPWFPVFWSNVVRWADPFAPLPEGVELEPGRPARLIRHPRADRITVSSPAGDTTEFSTLQPAVLDVQAPGAYTVRQFVGQELVAQTSIDFAPEMAAPTGRVGVPVGSVSRPESTPRVQQQTDVWPWVAVLALALLVAEWWIFHRVRGIR